MTVRTRFAPSPTGYLHIGGARTALSCWLEARRNGGRFILRIEDTDRERSTPEAVETILEGMRWLELDWDEGPFFQTERFDRYREVVQQLLDEGKAYWCTCSREELDRIREQQRARGEKPRYPGTCRHRSEKPHGPAVVRFRNPREGEVVVDDLVRGKVVFRNEELDDLIIARSDGTPTYNLTVVVDDMDMGVTEVIRGEDHLNNTPRQINIYRALGVEPPRFAHVSMIHGPDGAKLSKRHGAVSVLQYRDDGYLPDAVVNYLARLGWSHGDQEVFTRDELVRLFDIRDVSRSASVFNSEKLLWLNHQWIMHGPVEATARHLRWHFQRAGLDEHAGPKLETAIPLFAERAKTLLELRDAMAFLYREVETYEEKAARKHLKPAAAEPLARLHERLAALTDWQAEPIHAAIQAVAAELDVGMGKVGMPMRVALTGMGQSPAINEVAALMGREATLRRLQRVLDWLSRSSES